MEASVITLKVKLESTAKKDGNRGIARCIPLDVLSQGETREKAFESLTEAVQLWFESCIDRDVLSSASAESGFIKVTPDDPVHDGASVVEVAEAHLPNSRKARVPDYVEVEVPAYMAAHLAGFRGDPLIGENS